MLKKYASLESAQILDVKGSKVRQPNANLTKIADFDEYRTDSGYLYARIRAISSRVNLNFDGWPSIELAGGEDAFNRIAKANTKTANFVIEADSNAKYGYSTFLGKPIFVDHHNSDPANARGVVVDAKLHIENHKTAAELDPYYATAPDSHLPPTWVELLLEIDAKSFPKLATAIIEGSNDPTKGLDGFSMGCDCEQSRCSHCGNIASSPSEFCTHVKLKGAEFPYFNSKTGKTESKKAWEECEKFSFFELSIVFTPADETALSREVIPHTAAEHWDQIPKGDPYPESNEYSEIPLGEIACPDCQGRGCERCYGTGQINPEAVPSNGEGYVTPQYLTPKDVDLGTYQIDPREKGLLGPRRQGNFMKGSPDAGDDSCFGGKPGSAKKAFDAMVKEYGADKGEEVYYATRNKHKSSIMQHTAENPPPQVDELKVPEAVNTLRDESICPVCGSDLSDNECAVCGFVSPPKGFDNPDLTKAQKDTDSKEPQSQEQDDTFGGPKIPEGDATSNNPSIAHINHDMPWTVTTPHEAMTKTAKETPVVPNAGPATDEPKKAVVKQDHTKPVTSKVRTAEDFLAAAGATRRTMSTKTADAASGAPEAATPDTSVDVTGVGGVIEPSNEEASKADAQIDVTGIGTTGVSDVAADSTESVDQGSETSKNIEEIPTKTWGVGTGVEDQTEGVTNEPYPSEGGVTSNWQVTALDSEPFPTEDGGLAGGDAVQGTQPADPVGVADERVNVLEPTTTPDNNSGETKTWSGTDGNKIYRQQDPVTNETLEGEDIVNLAPTSSTHLFAAIKLADQEVALGLTSPNEKYDRYAELEKLSPEELKAEARTVSRVKTAGLSKVASSVTRVPPMGRNASVEKESSEDQPSEMIADSSIFLK